MDFEKPDWLQQTEGILETLNEGVLILDDCSRAIYANDALTRVTGFAREEILGRTPAHFWQGADLEELQRQVRRSHEQGYNRHEFFLPRADGSRVPAILSTRMIEDLNGREFAIVNFTDITEQKRAEDQLRRANQQLEQRQQEIDRDLDLAARVQQSLAPQSLTWGPFRVEALYQPVSSIGGDFGAVTPSGDQLNLLVCDVSGHGISSALIANRIYSEAISLLGRCKEVRDMLTRLNNFVLHQMQMNGFYFSMALARLDAGRRHMCFANAGHPPAILLPTRGEIRLLGARSAVLGLVEDAVPADPAEQIDLAPGDRVMLYTDGISEVFNEMDEQLGHQRLAQIARAAAHRSLPEMKAELLHQVAAWRHGPVTDDISLVLIEVQ
jgi:sigma-B regulation protein RsbU (phosphoserine phosphatase)